MRPTFHVYTVDEIIEMMESGVEGPLHDEDEWLDSLGYPELTDEEIAARQRHGLTSMPPFGFPHWTFDVLDGGRWYRIDAAVPESDYYEGVPEDVQRRACTAVDAVIDAAIDAENGVGDAPTTILRDIDHTDEYEAILRTVFDDVRFVETDFKPGVIVY